MCQYESIAVAEGKNAKRNLVAALFDNMIVCRKLHDICNDIKMRNLGKFLTGHFKKWRCQIMSNRRVQREKIVFREQRRSNIILYTCNPDDRLLDMM